jgi:hypothetical protein
MSSAGQALQAAAMAALSGVGELSGLYPGAPLQAVPPYAVMETGLETDWGHKSGAGRELRLAITLHSAAERPDAARGLAVAAEAAVAAIGGELDGWRLVSLAFLRSRIVQERKGGWAAVLEWRARMLAL